MTTTKRRRVEITFFEHERIVRRSVTAHCTMCRVTSDMLTPEQAGDLAQVEVQRIYEWLAQGRAHSMKMLSGQDRICKNSLFESREE